jgi:hypothetical protein
MFVARMIEMPLLLIPILLFSAALILYALPIILYVAPVFIVLVIISLTTDTVRHRAKVAAH